MARQGYHAVKYLQSLEKYRDMALLLCFDLNNINYYFIISEVPVTVANGQLPQCHATGTLRKTGPQEHFTNSNM